MPNYTRNMNQVATYWPPGSNDGSGGTTFGAPTTVKCRWQNKADRVRTPDGDEFVSSAVVYPDEPLERGGYLALGLSFASDPRGVGLIIQQVGDSPNLAGGVTLNKVWL